MKQMVALLTIWGSFGCRQEVSGDLRIVTDRIGIASALTMYFLTTGKLPTAEQGLSALVKRPADLPAAIDWEQMMKKVPTDPWGNEYQYSPPADGNSLFELRSLGRDGVRSPDDQFTTFRVDRSAVVPTNHIDH